MASRKFVASRAELVDAGFTRSRINNWIRNGRMIKILRGVYCYGRDVESRGSVFRAALVAAGPGSVLIGRSACEVWGIVKPRDELPRVVEVAVARGATRSLPGLSPALRRTTVKVWKRQVDRRDIRHREGLELTSPALALIEFAARASRKEVRFAFLEACRLGLLKQREVAYCFGRISGRRGAKKLKPLLALWVPELNRIRSVLEGLFLLVWVQRGLPMPKVNVKVFGYEVDDFWEKQGLVLELDGDAFHRDPAQRSIDAAKQRELEARGLTVIRVTYAELERDPDAVVRRIMDLLGLD